MKHTNVNTAAEHGTIQLASLTLESGKRLKDISIAFERAGSREAPVLLICHALTGNHITVGSEKQPGWWSGLVGENKWIDTSHWQVITMNVLGGCSGSTGPVSINPVNHSTYRADFPLITVRDIVKAQYQALQLMNVKRVRAVIGASLGGMQVLEWGLLYPDFVEKLIPIAVTPYLSDYAISYNAVARTAITTDPAWCNGYYDSESPPANGLGIARMIGMITYRSAELYNERFARKQVTSCKSRLDNHTFEIESYLDYQGKKLASRFDANSYLYLLKAMDNFDIGRDRGGWKTALENLRISIHAFAFKGDLLYPPEEVRKLVHNHTNFYEVDTKFGHDRFLVEYEKWGPILKECLHDD